ncbi:dihydrolipoyl dehydrogenase [Spiractinospora alimapuensis]|uniref:dihydrolipoyl dehydrogenase n=1 Tax=Spiractinospora alimapuensis TaxID=2820884 RepID=UPI001EECE9DB|nr:dihydrolipoyl dehydrogenase [Spiractinospora alimapuensis]QVQ53258.1 dihydrolipoyl dehydrogenase [Spiractinospora alimapuensis]
MSDSGGTFDLVILGGGSGGYAAALRAAELGMSVALIEKDKVGGTCLHYGCIPTKALLHAAEVADSSRESETFGVKSTFEGIDMAGVNAYREKIIAGPYKGLSGLIKSRGITTVEGHGTLTAPNQVTVDGTVYEGRNILLATGSKTKTIGLDIDGTRLIDSEQALRLDYVPKSAIVLGGGVIGVEFASVWRSFGAEVTIVEALPHLLPSEDEDSSKLLERAFRKRGIKFELGTPFESHKITDSGVSVTLQGGKTLEADVMLVAVGRGPVSEGLGYEEQGISLDRGFVLVDENLHTGVGNIYAVGDLTPGPQLAHVGFGEGIFVAEQIAGLNPVPIDYDGVPRVTYSDPEVASVGLTSKVAQERGYETEEYTFNLAGLGKARILNTQGALKMISAKDGPILGVHVVGSRVGDLITEGQLLYNWEALPSEVAQLIHPHPSMSEAMGEAALALTGKPLHTHD